MQQNKAFIFWCAWVTMNEISTTCGLRKKTSVPMLASEYNLCQSCSSSQKSSFADNTLKL